MKKNDLLLLGSLAAYSYLFYNQSAGVNYLLFNLLLIFALMVKNGVYKNLFNAPYWLSIAGSILSSVCILLYGNTLSIIATVISISLVAAFSMDKSSSLLFAGLYAIYSYLSAIAMVFIDWAEKNKRKGLANKKGELKLLLFIIPLIVSLIFFFLYRDANPLFKNFTSTITFDFISWAWVRFILVGFILLYGFIYHRSITLIANKDLAASSTLSKTNFSEEKNTLWGFKIDFSNELLSGIILFSLLNILLLFVNILDLQYLWLTNSLPEGVTFSESVHQGIGTLITSIIFAVAIILIIFRGNINFHTSGKTIKILAYLWIIQNVFMVVSTLIRNQLYVNEFSLTYKRIGVYVYLTLAIIGLLTTLIKIARAKSNWYLFRSNSWLVYCFLVLSCTINWDRVITAFNLSHSKTLDLDYLTTLSSSNTDLLLNSEKFNSTSEETNQSTLRNLHIKTFNFLASTQNKEWQSWNLEDQEIEKNITTIEKNKKVTSLILYNNALKSLAPILHFGNLKKINLSGNQFNDLSELSSFPLLEDLDLNNNTTDSTGVYSLKKLPILKNLKSLALNNNAIKEFYGLENTQQLEHLDISYTKATDLNSLPVLSELKTLDVSGNNHLDFTLLGKFNSLCVLKINSTSPFSIKTLPLIATLKELECANSNLVGADEDAIKALTNLAGLEKLNLSNNKIENSYLINETLFTKGKKNNTLLNLKSNMPLSLSVLNLSNNKIIYLDGIEKLERLVSLDIANNEIETIIPIQYCKKIEYLNFNNNKINQLNPLATLNTLKTLLLSNNNIIDISALKTLRRLEYLDLSNNKITDISSLSTLDSIKFLDLSGNLNLTDLSVIQNLKNLEELDLTNCPINDLVPLYNLKKLKKLKCTNLTPLGLEKLKKHLPTIELNNNEYYSSDVTSSEN